MPKETHFAAYATSAVSRKFLKLKLQDFLKEGFKILQL